jgi:transcriptional regulator with XRE-family HTH domain
MTIPIKLDDEFEKDTTDFAAIGRKVRAARSAVGYSIEQMAVTCGLSHHEIVAIEDGADADIGRLKRAATALKLDIADLLNGGG